MKKKKEKLKEELNIFISCVIDQAEKEDKLDFFNIEINNHMGNLQKDYTLRDRKKVYWYALCL